MFIEKNKERKGTTPAGVECTTQTFVSINI